MIDEAAKPALLQGNEAIAEGAIAAGARFFAGYPITPSSEIAEALSRRLPQVGGTFIQMEDEIGSICAVIGASLTGTKALTATSGPGFSLMQEGIGFAAMSEVPCVIVDVQRVGPCQGIATAPAQGDVMQARYGAHGPHSIIALSPSSVQECFEVTVKAFNLAEQYRTPVVILTDAVIGHLRELFTPPVPGRVELIDRRRPRGAPGEVPPYDIAADDRAAVIPNFGDGYKFHVTGLFHDQTGFPTTKPSLIQRESDRLVEKIEAHEDELTYVERFCMDDAEVAVIAYGCVGRSARGAVRAARSKGIKAGLLRLITIWPFPKRTIAALGEKVPRLVVAEMNTGYIADEVRSATCGRVPLAQANTHDGQLITIGRILNGIEEVMSRD